MKSSKPEYRGVLAAGFTFMVALASALAVFAWNVSASTVDPDDEERKFAYGEAIDWINFDPGVGPGVAVTETAVTGHAWSDAVGWINFALSSGSFADRAAKTAWDHAVSGNAGAGEAVLSYDDGGPKTATAGDGGDYSFAVSYGWSGTVTPSKTGYDFAPASRNYTEVKTDRTDQNYTATPTNWTVSPSDGPEGAVAPDAPQAVAHGNAAVFAIVPAENYRVQTPVGGTCGGDNTGNPADSTDGIVYTTGPVTADCTVVAAFASAAPVATTRAASSVGETAAMLDGAADPNGLATVAWFEWGTDGGEYVNRLPALPDPGYDAGSEGPKQIGDLLAGLTASTSYRYRAVAQNSAGTSYGEGWTFTTGEIDSTCPDHWPVKIDGEYEFLSGATAGARDGDAFLLSRTGVSEDVIIEMEDAAILLQGGWSCDFGRRTDPCSTIRGSLTIAEGATAIMDGIVISSAEDF